jgi:hypothetical protein
MNRRNLAIGFLALLVVLMFLPDMPAISLAPTGKTFYMTLPAPTSLGPKPLPTATHIPPLTSTPTMKTCQVFFGKWVGPCQP